VACHMESLFVFVHGVWNVHPLLHYSFLWELCCRTHYYCFLWGEQFLYEARSCWEGPLIWNKNIFKVAFHFLFLVFLALTMFTNICTTKFIFDHFWNVLWEPQTTHTIFKCMFHFPCFIFHSWKCYCWSIECFACDGDMR